MEEKLTSNVRIYTVPIFPPPHGVRDDFPPGQYVLYSDYLALKRAAPEPAAIHDRQLSASQRLHNICDALGEQLDESPFTREEWDAVDKETVRLQNRVKELEAEVSTLRDHLAEQNRLLSLNVGEVEHLVTSYARILRIVPEDAKVPAEMMPILLGQVRAAIAALGKNRPTSQQVGLPQPPNADLRAALVKAVEVIQTWHNMDIRPQSARSELWDIYWKNAPEMKPIREALTKPARKFTPMDRDSLREKIAADPDPDPAIGAGETSAYPPREFTAKVRCEAHIMSGPFCMICGASVPEPPETTWDCSICGRSNYVTVTHCEQCEYSRMVTQEGRLVPRVGR